MPSDLPAPLQVPDQPRRLRFHRYQWIGLPLLLLIPLLALLGVFGETFATAEDRAAGLDLHVVYASRYRYKQINTVEAYVTNTTGATLDTVVVAFDPAYVRRFSTLTFIPSPTTPFEVELLDVRPGETRLVWAELQGERYGRHRGTLAAYAPGAPGAAGTADTARVTLRTTIFP